MTTSAVSGVPLLECAALGFLLVSWLKCFLISHRCDKTLSKTLRAGFFVRDVRSCLAACAIFRCDAGYGCHVDLFNYIFICLFISGRHCVLVGPHFHTQITPQFLLVFILSTRLRTISFKCSSSNFVCVYLH